MTKEYHNFTLAECDKTLSQFEQAIRDGRVMFWQKFTCDSCWRRLEVEEPNLLFQVGHCTHCGHDTDLKKTGCNYTLMIKRRQPNGGKS